MNFEPLLLREEGTTAIITISRPEAMNALNHAVLSSLGRLLDWLSSESASHLRCAVITGAGEKAFVAGADIKEFVDMQTASATKLAESGQALFSRIEKLNIPVIAAVNGFALGGGLELALACDFIYAAEHAKFGLPECTLGLMPGYGGTVRLPRRVGIAKAREMTYTGGMIDAAEALRIGLANRVVPAAQLLPLALETAHSIGLRAAPKGVAAIKKSLLENASLVASEGGVLEARLFGELFATDDKNEGVRAFIEKRKPSFKGS